MNPFLPENYERPVSSGNYMKFADGPNKLRIMSAPIFGHEYWTKDKKPALHQRGLFLWSIARDPGLDQEGRHCAGKVDGELRVTSARPNRLTALTVRITDLVAQ